MNETQTNTDTTNRKWPAGFLHEWPKDKRDEFCLGASLLRVIRELTGRWIEYAEQRPHPGDTCHVMLDDARVTTLIFMGPHRGFIKLNQRTFSGKVILWKQSDLTEAYLAERFDPPDDTGEIPAIVLDDMARTVKPGSPCSPEDPIIFNFRYKDEDNKA